MNERRYRGHFSCQKMFADAVEHISDPEGNDLCVEVPPVTPSLKPDFDRLLKKVSMNKDAELSLNDWGSLYYCSGLKKSGLLKAKLTTGVLLAGQDTDPILNSFEKEETEKKVITKDGAVRLIYSPPSKELVEHWSTPSIFSIVPLLKRLGVTRMEVCAQPLPFPEKEPGLPVTLFQEAIVSIAPCKRECSFCSLKNPILRGDTMLYFRENLLLADLPAGFRPWIDRVVSAVSFTDSGI